MLSQTVVNQAGRGKGQMFSGAVAVIGWLCVRPMLGTQLYYFANSCRLSCDYPASRHVSDDDCAFWDARFATARPYKKVKGVSK